MKKMHYRTTVNIKDRVMMLGFRGQLTREHEGKKIRVQAVFSQRQVDRRFPMEVTIEETDIGPQIMADARVELPYVFLTPPRRKVNVTFAVWFGMEEMLLDDQPFPVQRELFVRNDVIRRKNPLKFIGLTAILPLLLGRYYLSESRNFEEAKKKANEHVYRSSGISYSPRQRNTTYFADRYDAEVQRFPEVEKNRVLFLSEREPQERDNLLRIKRLLSDEADVEIAEFINTKTVDALTRQELRECAAECARAQVIILEDFYPQLHSLNIRPETRVIQLWHACGAYKTFGFSHMDKPGGAPQSSMNHRNYDLVCVSSSRIRGIYAEAFAIPLQKVKALGVPRTDDLFDEDYKSRKREELYRKYPLLQNSKVVLFAPTFRGTGNKDAFYPWEKFDPEAFLEGMPGDVVCIIKNHPFVKESPSLSGRFGDRIYDLSDSEYINDLMLVSDLMITDYSSAVFEAAILDLPMIFYTFDLEDYIRDRDFYFDFEGLVPGPIERTKEDLAHRARIMLEEKGYPLEEADKLEYFKEVFLDAIDGHSSERVFQYIRSRFLKL